MTLQEAKDQVARKCGFEDFRHAEFSGVFEDRFWEESAELYARSKWDEAHQYYSENFDGNLPPRPEFNP